MMSINNEVFRCNVCNRYFETPDAIEETHGFSNPPYEKFDVCPNCRRDDFVEFSPYADKIEIASKILYATSALNRYCFCICDIFGSKSENDDLNSCLQTMNELIGEMFDFIPAKIERLIEKMQTDNDVERVLYYLRG